MRSLRNAAAALLLSAALVVAGASAALAGTAVQGIDLGSDRDGVGQFDRSSVCAYGGPFQSGQSVVLQVLKGSSWVTARTLSGTKVAGQQCVQFVPGELVPGAGTYTLRAVTQISPTEVADDQVVLTFTKDDGTASVDTHAFVWTTARGRAVSVLIPTAHGQVVELQRRSNGRWVYAARATAPRSGTFVDVRVPVPARTGSATYRILNRETAWNSMFITPAFELHQATTPAYRREYAAVARKYIAAYCPKTPIYVDTPEVVAGAGALGVAGWWTTSKGRTVTLHTEIRLRAHLPAAQLRHVALHECAHILQSRAVPANRYDQERQRQWKLYPTMGHEGQADCMAYYLVKDKRQLAYLKSCTAAQLVDAKRMWATYGRKYQAANYRWTV